MRTAVILAAGDGTKLWPYGEIRPKALIPVGGTPTIGILIEQLEEAGFEQVIVAVGTMGEQVVHYLQRREHSARIESSATPGIAVTIVRTNANAGPRGTAYTLAAAGKQLGDEPFLVLYGDTVLESSDIARLVIAFDKALVADSSAIAAALVSPLGKEASQDWICCRVAGDRAELIMGHPREAFTHRFCAFAFTRHILPYCAANSGIFSSVQVGMMPPLEGHLEMSLADWTGDGHPLIAVETEGAFFDIDKPWHILQANEWRTRQRCEAQQSHELAEGATIDATASIRGYVRLGPNSRIGRNVTIEGNIIVGSNTTIENGAILQGSHVIGDDTYIGNYCYLAAGSTVGNRCVISHCAELEGMIMDNVYLYHYMEIYGVVGTGTDIGAATVCGSLRFDDGSAPHRIKGRKETPRECANAVFIGDYARTGVNAVLMPGVKVGVNSVVGPGVVLYEDLPSRQIVTVKQELTYKPWGPERYGW